MTWNAFQNRVETLRAAEQIADDEHDVQIQPTSDRESFVRRIKAVLAA